MISLTYLLYLLILSGLFMESRNWERNLPGFDWTYRLYFNIGLETIASVSSPVFFRLSCFETFIFILLLRFKKKDIVCGKPLQFPKPVLDQSLTHSSYCSMFRCIPSLFKKKTSDKMHYGMSVSAHFQQLHHK